VTYTIDQFGPSDLLTSKKFAIRRVQVDVGNTGFFDGREFRFFRELDIPAGTSLWTRITVDSGSDGFIVRSQTIEAEEGTLRFRVWTDTALTTPPTFSAPDGLTSNVLPNNTLPSAPAYTRTTVFENGGDADPVFNGDPVLLDILRSRSSGSTSKATSNYIQAGGERGVGPGTYWLQFESLGNADVTGLYNLIFEERIGQG